MRDELIEFLKTNDLYASIVTCDDISLAERAELVERINKQIEPNSHNLKAIRAYINVLNRLDC